MSDNPGTITVQLSEPVALGEAPNVKTFSEITFRKLKGRDLLAMDKMKGEMAKTFAMLASMGGVPFQVFEEMDTDDFQKAMLAIVPLMGKSGRAALAQAMAEEAAGKDPLH